MMAKEGARGSWENAVAERIRMAARWGWEKSSKSVPHLVE
jgi:hypothetical protein